MPKPKDVTARLPRQQALQTLDRGQRTLLDYAKVSPDALREPQAVPSTVLSVIASQRRR